MVTTLRATFDGKVLVPDGAVDLRINTPLVFDVRVEEPAGEPRPGLLTLLELADQFPPNPDAATDGAAQHDHYLYGTPKRMSP